MFATCDNPIKCSHTTNYKTEAGKVGVATAMNTLAGLLSSQLSSHSHRVDCREVFLTPLQATDAGGTITMVTTSGRSFTRHINTEDTPVQETNPATPGQLVLGN